MAALRPESEKLVDEQLSNGVSSGENHTEAEGEFSAGEAGHSDAGSTKECSDVSPQTRHPSLTQAQINPDANASAGPHNQQAPKLGLDSQNSKSLLGLSETEDDCALKPPVKLREENTGHELNVKTEHQSTQDIRLDASCEQNDSLSKDEEEEFTDVSVELEHHEQEKEADGLEEEEGEPEGRDERKEEFEEGDEEECREMDASVKHKRSRLECRDCGKKFTRRETFNLHRHFHMHQDEQASLTCKECGLTFQHRSSLIKHRSEHKQNDAPPPAPSSHKRSPHKDLKEEKTLECDHCADRFGTLIAYKLHACRQKLEKPYRCPLCRKEFQYRVSINAHMQSHSLDSPYRCLECNKGFQCALTLHIHQRSHAALKPYECPDCGMVFRHRSFMEDHRRRHTEEQPHQCQICGKTFNYSSLLQQHQYLHTGQKPYRCPECGKRFAFAQNMRAHCRQHKRNLDSASSEPRVTNYGVPNGTDLGTLGKENTNRDLQQQRNCPLCPQLFYKAADLRAHMLIHEAEYEKMMTGKQVDQVYACPYCPLKFMDESTLQSHTLTHQIIQAPLKREVLSVARAGSVDNMSGGGEWVEQTEKKSLRCKECGKSFRYRSVLELHMRIHNKGYQCHICKKSFRFSSYLQQHLIIHSGKKPFKCPDCGKDFAFLQNMKTHQRLHQQKPFRCTQCRKGYSDEAQLQRHMLSHSGDKPHKCHLCDKSFGLAYLLRDHLNTHTGERPHRCQECHKSFPWLSSLLVHQKIHVRKRQGLSQSASSFGVSQRGRTRGGGGRGRRSIRWASGWPRMGGDMGRTMPLQQATFPGQILQGSALPHIIGQQQSVFDSHLHEQTQLSSQQPSQSWQTDNQSRPVQLQQQWQIQIRPQLQHQQQPKLLSEGQSNDVQQQWQQGAYFKPILPKLEGMPKFSRHQQQQKSLGGANVLSTQTGPTSKQNLPQQDNTVKAVSSRAPSKAKNEPEQRGHQHLTLSASSPSSSSKSPCNADEQSSLDVKTPNQVLNIQSQQLSQLALFTNISQNIKTELPSPSEEDDNSALGVKTADRTLQADNDSDKPVTSRDDPPSGQQPSGPADVRGSVSASRSSLEISKTVTIQGKLLNERDGQQSQQQLTLQSPPQLSLLQEQQLQQIQLLQQQNRIAPLWVSQPNQMGSLSVQLGGARFTPGNGSTVWGFQAAPVVSQTLVNGPLQQGSGQTQPQAPVVTGPQILLNQTSPFISLPLPLPSPLALPGSHPIHSVAAASASLAASASQGIFLAPQSIKDRTVIPLAPDRRYHCVVCGSTLPGERELQMHYMQHAQGEI